MILGTESANYDYLKVGNLELSVFLFRKEFIVTHIYIVAFDIFTLTGLNIRRVTDNQQLI